MKPSFLRLILCLGAFGLLGSGPLGASTSSLAEKDGTWTLLADGKPFFVKGITFGIPYDKTTVDGYMDQLAALGCNTVRTWGAGDETQVLLDSAQKHGIKVMVGLWLRHGRAGMEGDDAFDWVHDQAGRDAQWKATLANVARFKDHPALLMWGVGNEVILNIATDEEKQAYAGFLQKLCVEIKNQDPNHLVASASAWTIDAAWWAKAVPALDVYGCNVYGGGAGAIAGAVKALGVDKPYVLTEFGAQGEWDVPKDANGLPTEPSDAEKYDTIAQGWKNWIENKPTCLGAYVFNFGNNWDHGAVWLSLMMKDYRRPSYWAVQKAFTGRDPAVAPVAIGQYQVPPSAKPGDWVPVTLVLNGPTAPQKVEMFFNDRTGSRAHRDAIFPLETKGTLKDGLLFKVPGTHGVLKVYAFVYDGDHNLAIAQQSLVVSTDGTPAVEPKVPSAKGALPLAVYDQDPVVTGVEPPFVASGLMGSYQDLSLDYGCTANPRPGRATCLKVTFKAYTGWVGCAWQNPANNWGTLDGGYDLTGAKRLTFLARGDQGGEKVSFGYGLLGADVKFHDSSKATTGDLRLGTTWKQYTLDLSGKDLRKIITGFTFFTGGEGQPVQFYLDDIRFE